MPEKNNHSSASSGNESPVNEKKESLQLETTQDAALEKQKSDEQLQMDINAKLANPLKQFSREEVAERGKAFAIEAGLPELASAFSKAALIARDPSQFENMPELSDEEKEVFRRETTHKWSYPKTLYLVVVACSISATVQGMDQSVINGANLFWAEPDQLNVSNSWQKGIVNAIPYFSSALLASWFTAPCNAWLGRRGTLWVSCFIAFATCLWSGFVGSWWELFLARLFLGFAIGPKSSTTPVYAAECAPASIRGGLVMQWQLYTALGIALGYVADIGFYFVDDPNNLGLNWRLMLGSALIPAIPVMILLFFVPESPRWLISKGRFADSFRAMRKLRNSDIQAARDCYFAVELIRVEEEVKRDVVRRMGLIELFSNQRNRKGVMASSLVMFMQQFCGINVIAYYSSSIFLEAIDSQVVALAASLGFGILNFLGGIPAIWTIDTFGRRSLLLVGYPLMSVFLFWTGFSFWLPEGSPQRIGMIAVGIYLHCLAYSPTSGPVPFSYSAEAFPLSIRDIGMSWAVSLTWFFNGVLSLTFPALQEAFTNQGAFSWYAAWNIFGFVTVFFLLPETKGLTLEELEAVFSVSNREHSTYMLKKLPYYVRKIFFFSKEEYKGEPLYAFEKLSEEERRSKGTFAPVAVGH